jgi:phosphatidylinositol alpha 1,6-mannosyltransferase
LRASLEHLAPERSFFLGHCEREKLPSLYHAADVFIHPNSREPFGIAPLEAMAAGLPLVAPASGGILTYANFENAWLADNTAESFADAVQSVNADSSLRRAKIEFARRTAAQFSWPRITQNYFRIYDEFYLQSLRAGLVEGRVASVRSSESYGPSLEETV